MVVVDGRRSVAVVDGKRHVQRHLGVDREAKPGLILSKLILI